MKRAKTMEAKRRPGMLTAVKLAGLTALTVSMGPLACDKTSETGNAKAPADEAPAMASNEGSNEPSNEASDPVSNQTAEGSEPAQQEDPTEVTSNAAPTSGEHEGDEAAATGASSGEGEGADASGQDPSQTAEKQAFALPRAVHRSVDDSCGKGPGVGSQVKSFKLQTPGGRNISPGMFRGRVVLLNFWGTWCKPCLEELPEFDRLYRRYRKHGLSLVAVATDEDPEGVQEFLDKKKIAAKVAVGGEGAASAYGAKQFPFTFVVDGKGVIRGSYNGYKPECMGKLEQDIREQLEALHQ